MDAVFLFDIGAVIVFATIFGAIASFFRQPMIPAYIIAGAVIGPFGLGIITNQELITTLSELGIAFLLFIIGMELNFSRLKDVSTIATAGTVIQVALSFAAGFSAARFLLGFGSLEAVYVGLVIAFSSTMVVIKLLVDKDLIETLHGRIALGVLLVQDVIVVLALSVLSNIDNFAADTIIISLMKGIGLFSIAIVASNYIFPTVVKALTKNPELMFLMSLSVSFIFGGLAYVSGYSIAVGGFLAGISLAVFPYNIEIISRITSLRDFFATMFFVCLGMQIAFSNIASVLPAIIVLTVITAVIKPAIITFLGIFFGYGRRTSISTGLSLAQVSEFSIIIVGAGLALGHVSAELLLITTMTAVITISMTPYFIEYSPFFYRLFSGFLEKLKAFQVVKNRKLHNTTSEFNKKPNKIIICGAHTMGKSIADELLLQKENFVVIDYNPEAIKVMMSQNIPCIYGDITHAEVLERVNISHARLLVSTIPSYDANASLINTVRKKNKNIRIMLTTNSVDDALHFYAAGATYVLLPKLISGQKAIQNLDEFISNDERKINSIKKKEVLFLERNKEGQNLKRYENGFLRDIHKKVLGNNNIRSP
ncbi:MAG: cation:proton antiporter [Candidatus Aenigmarchaeota archaeon]|nr:cation:proton antiporter [Candidatus Aenigmarchaeota archaeon]